MERRGVWCPTVVRPDHAGICWSSPVDVCTAIVTKDDLRVRMIAKGWKSGNHGCKGPDRIVRPEPRNHADPYAIGVRLAVDQPEPAPRKHDTCQRRVQGTIRKLGRREYGPNVPAAVSPKKVIAVGEFKPVATAVME